MHDKFEVLSKSSSKTRKGENVFRCSVYFHQSKENGFHFGYLDIIDKIICKEKFKN